MEKQKRCGGGVFECVGRLGGRGWWWGEGGGAAGGGRERSDVVAVRRLNQTMAALSLSPAMAASSDIQHADKQSNLSHNKPLFDGSVATPLWPVIPDNNPCTQPFGVCVPTALPSLHVTQFAERPSHKFKSLRHRHPTRGVPSPSEPYSPPPPPPPCMVKSAISVPSNLF